MVTERDERQKVLWSARRALAHVLVNCFIDDSQDIVKAIEAGVAPDCMVVWSDTSSGHRTGAVDHKERVHAGGCDVPAEHGSLNLDLVRSLMYQTGRIGRCDAYTYLLHNAIMYWSSVILVSTVDPEIKQAALGSLCRHIKEEDESRSATCAHLNAAGCQAFYV
jgi:hypothetical protein